MEITVIAQTAADTVANSVYAKMQADLEALRILMGLNFACLFALLGVNIWKR